MSSHFYGNLSLIFFVLAIIVYLIFVYPKDEKVKNPESTQLLEDMEQLLKEYRKLNNAPTYDKEKHEELTNRFKTLREQMKNLYHI